MFFLLSSNRPCPTKDIAMTQYSALLIGGTAFKVGHVTAKPAVYWWWQPRLLRIGRVTLASLGEVACSEPLDSADSLISQAQCSQASSCLNQWCYIMAKVDRRPFRQAGLGRRLRSPWLLFMSCHANHVSRLLLDIMALMMMLEDIPSWRCPDTALHYKGRPCSCPSQPLNILILST